MAKKGVSMIIATILMLMVVIGLASIAYFFFSGVFFSRTSTPFTILYSDGYYITVRNDGTDPITSMKATLDGTTVPVAMMPNDNGIVGYWGFNNGSDDVAYDSSGNENHATINNPAWTDGKYGRALDFNALDRYADPGTKITMDINQSFTFAAWLRLDNTWDGNLDSIIYWWEGADGFIYRKYNFANPGEDVNAKYVSALSLENGTEVGVTGLVPGNPFDWHHHVARYDHTSETLSIYIDGRLENTADVPGHKEITSSALNYFRMSGAGAGWYFCGAMDEVQLYNRTLSESEITQLTQFWIEPGQTGTLKIIFPVSSGRYTLKLCTPSMCNPWYLDMDQS